MRVGFDEMMDDGTFDLSVFQSTLEAISRHDTLQRWQKDRLIQVAPFYPLQKNESLFGSAIREPMQAVRIVVGDTYIDEPVKTFPSERMIATIALLLQAQGKI